jgi:hypothetical protein
MRATPPDRQYSLARRAREQDTRTGNDNGALRAININKDPVVVIMSGTGPRESIFPTRMALTNTKTRLKGAQTGHSLLAKKRDALTTRFRAILRKVDEVSHPHPVNRITPN